MAKGRIWWLLAAVVVAGIVRGVWLGRYPAGFTADEAALGYNAYSLLKTGRDEWGTPWWQLPFTNLKSFGDYKLPLYSFLAVPAVKWGGLTEPAVRFPAALMGTLAVVSIFLLAGRLSGRSAPIAAWLLAISPWHIGLSRGAFEANLVTFFLPVSIYLFLRQRMWLSAVFLSLGFYSYHSARFLILPVVALLIWYGKLSWKKTAAYALVLVLLTLPGWWSLVGPGMARVSDVGIFHPTDNWQAVADRRFEARNRGLPDSLARVFSNKATYLAAVFGRSYLAYLSADFLFIHGPGEATYGLIPGRGVLYFVELPLMVLFLVRLVRRPTRERWLVVLLLLVTPLPAALAKGFGSAANRAVPMLPFLMIMAASSLVWLIEQVKAPAAKILVLAVYVFSLAFFIEDYVYHFPSQSARAMNYGWKEAVVRLDPISRSYSQVQVSRSLSEPHIFLAFYLPVPPAEYQAAARGWIDFDKTYTFLDQYDGYRLGKFRFGNISPTKRSAAPVMFVGRPQDFPLGYPEYFHIDYPGGPSAIQVSASQSL